MPIKEERIMFSKSSFYFNILAIVILMFTVSNAQEASAEFISSHVPHVLSEGEQVADGIQNIFLKDNLLYVTNVWSGLQILDVSNLEDPKEIGAFITENRSFNTYVEDNYAYISNELGGVVVLDVSDPANMRQVARIETEGKAHWVVARFPYVYVAEEAAGVRIYNIENLNTPRHVGSYDSPGWAWGLFLDGDNLYLSDKSGGMRILDVSNPASPTEIGKYDRMKHVKTVQVVDDIAYVSNGPAGLWIFDVSNPSSPLLISHLAVDGYIFDAYKFGNSVFLANESKSKLNIIDVSDIKNPKQEAVYEAEGKVYSALKHDVYVYVAADTKTLILRHNHPPQIAAISDKKVRENETLEISADAFDPDGDRIVFSVENMPDRASFDSLAGFLNWLPDFEQSGMYPNVKITATELTDSKLSESTTFDIRVVHVNRPPEIPDIPDTVVNENELLTFTIPEGADPDKEDQGLLTYFAENLAEGALFDINTREFSWTPSFEQSGIYSVDFGVRDTAGAVDRDVSNITVNHVDRSPVLQPLADQTVTENDTLIIVLEGSDPDAEDQYALSYSADNLPEGATFDPESKKLTWVPTYDQSGQYENLQFIFRAGALADSISLDVAVEHVNRPPVLDPIENKMVDENRLLEFGISGKDYDVEDKGKLVYSAENLPEGATFDADSLIFRWTPGFEQSGIYEDVKFSVSDPDGLEDSQTISITVNHVNRKPQLAEIGAKSVDENALLTFNLNGGDPDAEDAGKLTYSAEGMPEGATLDSATFNWTPTYTQSGNYTIAFTVSDGNLTDSKSASITVDHVNRPPALEAIADQTVNENEQLTFAVTGSDPDSEDAGKWKLSAENMPEGASLDTANAQFNWTPDFDQSGTYDVKFLITDPAGLTAETSAKITVNHVNRDPVFAALEAKTIDENSRFEFNVPPAGDPDAEDKGKLVYWAQQLPEGAVFDSTNLILTWRPDFDQSGNYTVNFLVSDGEFTVEQPLNITVNHVNRPPEIAPLQNQVVDENAPWQLTVDYSDPDKEDQGKLQITASNLPEGASFDEATAQVSWTPTFEQSGEYTGITFTVVDPAGLSDAKALTVTVNHVNRPPVLEAVAAQNAVENSALTFTLNGSDPDAEDEGKLVYSATGLPDGAMLNGQTGAFNWTPNFLQAGVYQVTLKVTDSGDLSDEQQTTITIEDLNRPPELEAIPAQTVNENEKLSLTISGSDPDTDNTLKYQAAGLPQGASFDTASHVFDWTPTFEQAGDYTVNFTVSDGKEEANAAMQITVANVNRPPKFEDIAAQTVDENKTLTFKVTASDADAGTELTFGAAQLPEGATFSEVDQTFSWTPGFEQAGTYSPRFTVSDGTDEVSMSVNITVNNVNRAPKIEEIAAQTTKENEMISFTVEASDEDSGTELTTRAVSLPDGAKFDAGANTFRWKPGYDQAGSYTAEFEVSDGEAAVTLPVQITVENVNREPTINGPRSREVQAGQPLELQYEVNDPDNDEITFSADNLPSGASIDADNGRLTWQPGTDQAGDYTIDIKASDGEAEAAMQTLIQVTEPPQTPADTSGSM